MSVPQSRSKTRVALLTGILTPYRAPIYRALGKVFDVLVILSGDEDNRQWSVAFNSDNLRVKTAWGFTLKRRLRQDSGHVFDLRYIHINPGYAWELAQYRPDAIVSMQMGFRSLVAIAHGRIFKPPVWIWWGGTLHTERNVWPLKRWVRRRFFAPCVHRWISYGHSSTEYLLSIGVPSSRILQVQNTVDDSRFSKTGPIMQLDAPRPRILFVGQLIARKGLGYLLEAAGQLHAKEINFSLVVVGDGPEALALKQQASDLALDNVSWLTYVDPEEMPSLYRACDVFVFATLEDVWGLVVNEALLCGLPVLASRYAGCAEELLPPENIFNPLDVEGLANLLARAIVEGPPPADAGLIIPVNDVAQMVIRDIESALQHPKKAGMRSRGLGRQGG